MKTTNAAIIRAIAYGFLRNNLSILYNMAELTKEETWKRLQETERDRVVAVVSLEVMKMEKRYERRKAKMMSIIKREKKK